MNLDRNEQEANFPAQLEDALAEWLELAETGAAPDEASFLRRFGHLDGLEAMLADWRKVRSLTHFIRPAVDQHTLDHLQDETHRVSQSFPHIPGYEIQSELGFGGMGVVYKAWQSKLARWVAIKVLRVRGRDQLQEVARFKNEAAIIAQLDHPQIVPIFEVGEHDGLLFFAMKWIDGGNLADQLRGQSAPLDGSAQRRAGELVATVARAVHYAHERGVLHRDLKPSNVLLDGAGRPYVSDFGLAKRLDEETATTQTGEFVGTPSYMAPEQASGKKNAVTTATDVHGLGALLYALLTGRAPFRGESVLQTLELVRERDPEAPRQISPVLDRDLETICLKCLQKDPQQRYPSAQAVAADLERWLAGEPILARPTLARERLVRWVRRRPALATALGLSGAALIALIAGLLIYNHNIGNALAEVEKLRNDGLKREAKLLRHVYVADLRAAHAFLEAGDHAAVLAILNRHVPEHDQEDLRGFEWHQMHAFCNYKPRTLGQHPAPILCLAVSPDDRWLATGDKEGEIKIWDLKEGAAPRTLYTSKLEITGLHFSPDGRTFASVARQEWQVRLWEVDAWKPKSSLVGFFCTARGVAFSPDSKQLAAALIDNTVRIWKLGVDVLPASLNAGSEVGSVTWSPDGKQLLSTGHKGVIKVWDTVTHKEKFALPGFDSTVLTGAFHPRRPLLAAGGYNRRIAMWDLTKKTERASHVTRGSVRGLAFSPDNLSLAAVAANGELTLLDLPIGQRDYRVTRVYRDGEVNFRGVAFLHQGRTLITGAEDGLVKQWDVARLYGVDTKRHRSYVRALSADGRIGVTCNPEEKTMILDTATLKPLGQIEDEINFGFPSAFSKSGNLLAFTSTRGAPRLELSLWDLKTFQRRTRFPDLRTSARGMVFSPDEETLIVGEEDGAIRIWDVRHGTLIATLQESKGGGMAHHHFLACSPDGKTLIAGTNHDGAITMWDLEKRTRRMNLAPGESKLYSMALSHDGGLLAAGIGPRLIQLWDLNAPQPTALDLIGSSQRVLGLAFSRDGRTLASAGEDRLIKLWHLPTAQPLFTLHHCRLPPYIVAFDGQDRTLTATSSDTSEAEVLRWSLPTTP